jgi:hypothetical protein
MAITFARPRIWRAVTGRWICHLVVGPHIYIGAGATPADAWRSYRADLGPLAWPSYSVSKESVLRETAPT